MGQLPALAVANAVQHPTSGPVGHVPATGKRQGNENGNIREQSGLDTVEAAAMDMNLDAADESGMSARVSTEGANGAIPGGVELELVLEEMPKWRILRVRTS